VQLSNPAQERARAALSLEQLTKDDRAKLGILVRRFQKSLQQQRAFDDKVAASLERLARRPANFPSVKQTVR
jgi:hypothetical protein